MDIACYRSAIAALFLLPFAWPHRRRLDWASAAMAAAYIGTVTFVVLATKVTTAANAIFLQYTAPVFVYLLAIPILGERPAGRDWVALGMAMVGIGWIFSGAAGGDGGGALLGLASGISFGLLIVLLRRFSGRDPYWVIFCNNAAVALLLSPWLSQPPWGSGQNLLLLLLLGIVQLGIPYVLFLRALRHVPAREAALIPLLEPLLNPVWVALAVGEYPSTATVVGAGFILLGLAGRYLKAANRAG